MKLYKLDKPQKIQILENEVTQPLMCYPVKKNDIVKYLGNIDGMYAPVIINDQRTYIAAWTKIQPTTNIEE